MKIHVDCKDIGLPSVISDSPLMIGVAEPGPKGKEHQIHAVGKTVPEGVWEKPPPVLTTRRVPDGNSGILRG